MLYHKCAIQIIKGIHIQQWPQITKFMGPTWGPPGSCRPQMGPMLAPWTLLSGTLHHQECWLTSISQGLYSLSCRTSYRKISWSLKAVRLYFQSLWNLTNYSAPSHYLNQWWGSVNWDLRNKFQRNLTRHSNIFIQENVFENIAWKMAAILSRPRCVII